MIKVTILTNCGDIQGFEVDGHADFKKSKTEPDALCASVSAIVQNTINFIYSTYKPAHELLTKQDGYIERFVVAKHDLHLFKGIQITLEFFKFSIESYATIFPDNVSMEVKPIEKMRT